MRVQRIITAATGAAAAAALAFLVTVAGQMYGDVKRLNDNVARLHGPVCYAQTEDSNLTGCDYHDGAWWPSR